MIISGYLQPQQQQQTGIALTVVSAPWRTSGRVTLTSEPRVPTPISRRVTSYVGVVSVIVLLCPEPYNNHRQ